MKVLIVFNDGRQMQVDTGKDNVLVTDNPMFGLFTTLNNYDAVINWHSVAYATVIDEDVEDKGGEDDGD